MFHARRCAAIGIGLMLAAASTEARELDFSVENRIGADSNVFRNSFDRVADGFYSLSPRVAVREGNSDLAAGKTSWTRHWHRTCFRAQPPARQTIVGGCSVSAASSRW